MTTFPRSFASPGPTVKSRRGTGLGSVRSSLGHQIMYLAPGMRTGNVICPSLSVRTFPHVSRSSQDRLP